MKPAEAECWYFDPYPVDSHRYTREQWLSRSRWSWRVAALPARGWRWRLRLGGAVLAERAVAQGGRPDLVVTTSLSDASQVRARLNCPVLVYWHENQLSYQREGPDRLGAGLRHAATLLATPWHAINSASHRDAFATAMEVCMRGWDADSRIDGLVGRIREMPVICPPVAIPADDGRQPPATAPLLLWNHRWCAEKRPEWLLDIVRHLASTDLDWRLAVVGSMNEDPPKVFDAIRTYAGHRLVAFGHQPRDRYLELLREASIVLSTAREENFGIAVAEAVAHGALPLLADLPVYRELWGEIAWIVKQPTEAARRIESLLRRRDWATSDERDRRRRRAAAICGAEQQVAHLDALVEKALVPDRRPDQILF